MSDLELAVRVIAGGVTLELEQGAYSLEASSRSTRATELRTHVVESPYVEGEYTVSAVKKNTVEMVAVYVEESTNLALLQAVRALENAFAQAAYTVQWDWLDGGVREVWKCFATGATVETSQPLMVAKTALVKLQVPRLPTTTIGAL